MFNAMKRFWNDETGPELVEWAVVTISLLVAAVILYIAVGRALGSVICSVECWLLSVTGDHGDIDDSTCEDIDEEGCERASG